MDITPRVVDAAKPPAVAQDGCMSVADLLPDVVNAACNLNFGAIYFDTRREAQCSLRCHRLPQFFRYFPNLFV